MTIPAERLARLPTWAREEIEDLTRALASARAERDAAVAAPPSNVSYLRVEGIVGDGPKEVFLPQGAIVRFYLSPPTAGAPSLLGRRYIDVNVVRAGAHPAHVRVATFAATVAVVPVAANCVHVMELPDA